LLHHAEASDSADLVREALAGDQAALARLVGTLTPVIQDRVVRTLLVRRIHLSGRRDVRQELEDLTQEVFLYLFTGDSHVLRGWEDGRGLSLKNFVGLISERHVVSLLRSGRRNPWKEEPVPAGALDAARPDPGPEEVTAGREQLGLLLERLRASLSPFGYYLFELLFVQQLSVRETISISGLSADAVYAWRSRLRHLARELMVELSRKAVPTGGTRKGRAEPARIPPRAS